MHARLCLLACTLPACFKEIHRPGCSEPVVTELADDEVSPVGVSADDLLAIASPGWEGIGTYANDSEVDVAFTIERGEGPATFLDTEPMDVVTRVFGLGDESLLIAVYCNDSLQVPVDFTLASDTAEIGLDMAATLSSLPPYSDVDPSAVEVTASQPYEKSGVVVPGIDPSFEEQTLETRVDVGDDGRSAGSIAWMGTSDTHATIVSLLEWSE